jgi:hypothetical protein
MFTLTDLIEQVRQFLIKSEPNISSQEVYNHFINQCGQLQLGEEDFYKTVLKPAHKSIDWEAVEAAKKQQQVTQKKIEAELQEKEETINNAPVYIERLVKTAFEDGIVEGEELKKIFDKAASLEQNVTRLAIDVNTRLDKADFKSYPRANFDAGSLKDTLISTNWYNPQLYASITAPPPPEPEPTNWRKIITATVLLLIVAGTVLYFAWYRDYIKDKNATRMYSYANSLSLRSSPSAGASYSSLDNLLYGTEILIYSQSGDWADCKANGKKGYVSTLYLLPKKEFQELNGILADAETRDAIPTTKCRKALLNYFNTHNIMGKIDETIQKEIYGSVQQKEIWQVFAKPKDSKPNNVIYPKVVNPLSKFTDFGCIIKNIVTGQRKFLLFSFADDEKEILQSEQEAPVSGYIQSISRYPYTVSYAQ